MNDAACGNLPESAARTLVEKQNPQAADPQFTKAPGPDSASVLNRIGQKFGIAGDPALSLIHI